MTAVWIVLAVLLAVVLLALGLFLFACRRRPAPDFTMPAVIAKWGRAEQTEEIFAGTALMQDAEDIFCRPMTVCAYTVSYCSSPAQRARFSCSMVIAQAGSSIFHRSALLLFTRI